MIFDKLKNVQMYFNLGERFKAAFQYLQNTDLTGMENGRYELCGYDVIVIIQDYHSKPEQEGKWEAHRKYIDIQYIIKGQERLGYLNIDDFTPDEKYDSDRDIVFGTGNGEFLTAKVGDFLVFTPQDAHMPSICVNEPEYVKKAVVKVKAD